NVGEVGRPGLKGKLTKSLPKPDVPVYDEKGNPIPGKTVPYSRKLADGGAYTATEAKELGLMDEIGYLEDATKYAAQMASLTDYQVVVYEQPPSLLGLFGGSASQQVSFDPARLASAATPRLWYLAPNCEFAGLFAAAGK